MIALLSFAALACCFAVDASPATTRPVALRVMSFNVRCDVAIDLGNRWEKRKEFLVDAIRAYGPDVLGTQEVLPTQGDFLREQLKGYAAVGAGRDDGGRRGEACLLFYRDDRFELLGSGQSWLGPTPDRAGSVGWDAMITRIVTWAKLRDRRPGGRRVLVLNTHFDHVGKVARLESARLVRTLIGELDEGGTLPTVLTGDFNCTELDPPYAALVERGTLVDAYRAVHPTPAADEASFHGFKGTTAGRRIDWILASPHLAPRGAAIDRTSRDGRYPSDHHPVTAEFD